MAFYDFRIAAGYSVALASLVNIEDVRPSGDVYFKPPAAYSNYTPGVFRIRGDGTIYTAGYAAQTWVFGALTRKQIEYLQDTYCAGGWSGKVTVYTRINRTAYARYNAVLQLPIPTETDRRFTVFANYPVRLIRMVAL